MTPQLQDFRNADAGFQQFCDLYKRAVSDPTLMQEYYQWCLDRMREEGMIAAAIDGKFEEGREEGLEIGREEERKKGRIDFAKSLIAEGLPNEFVARHTKLTIDEVQALRG
ncbi:MAG: hypothetical protein LBL49_07865 [Clostridiales Family XIII bacterium]|nr:hypothetical protein [Clostridiales Family XIII bacterium]